MGQNGRVVRRVHKTDVLAGVLGLSVVDVGRGQGDQDREAGQVGCCRIVEGDLSSGSPGGGAGDACVVVAPGIPG